MASFQCFGFTHQLCFRRFSARSPAIHGKLCINIRIEMKTNGDVETSTHTFLPSRFPSHLFSLWHCTGFRDEYRILFLFWWHNILWCGQWDLDNRSTTGAAARTKPSENLSHSDEPDSSSHFSLFNYGVCGWLIVNQSVPVQTPRNSINYSLSSDSHWVRFMLCWHYFKCLRTWRELSENFYCFASEKSLSVLTILA